MATFQPRSWQGAPAPSAHLHGLSEDVAEAVLTLRLHDFRMDLAELLPLLIVSSNSVPWPTAPPNLPAAPPIAFSADQTAEIGERDRQAERLGQMTPEASEQAGMSPADLQPLRDAARRQRVAQLQPDALAFYRPFSTLSREEAAREVLSLTPEWGIHLTSGGIEALAQEVFTPTGISDPDALRCATALLLGHELGHLLIDGALGDDDLTRLGYGLDDSAPPQAARHRAEHDGSACLAAEAFCEAYALSFLADALDKMHLDEAERQAAQAAAVQHVTDGLPGYLDGAQIQSAQARFEKLRDALEHAGITEDPDRAALLADLERRVLPASAGPIHLVVSPGSALSQGHWQVVHSQ